jgi:hypothetical protein
MAAPHTQRVQSGTGPETIRALRRALVGGLLPDTYRAGQGQTVALPASRTDPSRHCDRHGRRAPIMTAVSQWQLPIDSIDHARSLHRMLFETKFDETPADAFLGSPHIAAIQHRLLDLLTTPSRASGGSNGDRRTSTPTESITSAATSNSRRSGPPCRPTPADTTSKTSSPRSSPSPELLEELASL